MLPRFVFAVFLALSGAAFGSQVVFSEVMYQPLTGKPEFIEVENISATPLDMALWKFTDGVAFSLPDFNAGASQAHMLKGYERILFSSADDATTRAAYPGIPPTVRIFGPWTGALDNNGERITLKDKNGVIVCTLNYGDSGKWPVQADGPGHSLVLSDANRAPGDWRYWRASVNRNGSPGLADPAAPAAGIALNELHFAASPTVDWIEVRNNSRTATLSAAGLFVASKSDLSDKVALSGSLAPGAVLSVNVSFTADNSGDIKLFLSDATDNVLDALTVRRKTGRDTWQQFPAASREWYSATADTRDAQNNPARNTDIVINEIMADPPSNQREGEFVELFNRGASAVNVGGWAFTDGVSFTIPSGTTIPAGGYLVIGADAAFLNAAYPGLTALGNWSGKLANGSGDRLRLEDANGNLANQVDYHMGGEWPELAGGSGSSLELVNPAADNSIGSAWRESDESAKSSFTSFTVNLGTYADSTTGGVNDDELRMWLVGDGHVILKNLVLRPTAGGGNLLVNGEITTLANENVSGWQSRGTHGQTFSDATGVHLIADGHGDNKCNHMEKDAAGMTAATAYTLTFDARWVYGKPRVIAQSWDMSIGGSVLIPIPQNLGTPGAVNSRYLPSPPAQVTALAHSPAVPTTGQTVKVSARVSSSAALSSVTILHRLDSITGNAGWSSTAMNDAGTGGDVVAGDGVYTGQVPLASFSGYNFSGTIVEFYVRATTVGGQVTELPKGGAAVPGLWICDNQVPSTDLRRMRTIISAYWADALSQDSATGGHTVKFNYKYPRFSNHYFPCTFISNDSEIYYGASVRKTGSPFTRATNNSLDRARVLLPGDRDFRGNAKIYWDNDGAGGSMLHNRIMRYWLYLLGVPGNENEVCRVTKNSTGFAIRESNEVFDKDMLDRIWENGRDGQLFEIDDRFWIGDDGATRLGNADGSWDYKNGDSQGAENPTAYHNNFVPKSREDDYDYSGLIAWCKQLEQNTTITPEQLERMADTRTLTAYAAVRGYGADWDNITMSRGKNGFFYQRSTDQKFTFLHWDSDNAFQTGSINNAVVGTLTNVGTNAPGYYSKPYVRRYLNYYLNQMLTTYAANGPRLSAWLTAEENASTSYTVPGTYLNWPTTNATSGTAQTRVAVIQTFIGATSLNATFALTSPADGTTVGTNTVDMNGTAPLAAVSVICVGHPEAVFSWTATVTTDVSPWKLAGIQLASGANLLTFRMLDENGAQIGADLTRTINRTGNAAPVGVLTVQPSSQNVGLGQVVSLDAGASYDPEAAGPLSYVWTVTPSTGFATTVLSDTQRQLIFSVPGSYNVSVQITDAAAQVSTITRTLSVFSANDRDDFGGTALSGYTLQNIELLDNYSPDAWYSLQQTTGALVIQISDRAAKPLNSGAPTFPLITRPIPASTDFSLQTDLAFINPQIASYHSGLYLETVESGTTRRYVFGLDGGLNLRISLSSGGAAYSSQAAATYVGGDVVLRIVRTGSTLLFQRRVGGAWTTIHGRALAGGSTVTSGGLFASTSAAMGHRVAFDYLLLSDPGNSTDLVNSLRITEVMYNPAGAGGVEFVELQNISAAPISITGAYFENGRPFSTQFTFGNLTLQPGQYCVVTNSISSFQSLYGTSMTIAGQYTGSLNNDGEPITLRDAAGNLILDFTYSDIAPWPLAADGGGKSLEILDFNPALYGTGSNWRASQETGGSPGYLGFATDTDGDGFPDSVETAYGTNPASAASQPSVPATSRDALTGVVTLTWASPAGRSYTVQYRDDMGATWQTLTTVVAAGATAIHTDTGAAGLPTRFYRISTQFP